MGFISGTPANIKYCSVNDDTSLHLIHLLIYQLPSFQAGDKVRVLSNKELVQKLQQGHGGWNESMTAVRDFKLKHCSV